MTKTEIKKKYLKMIEDSLTIGGFKRVKERDDIVFFKDIENGFTKVAPLIWEHGLNQYISISLSIRLSSIQTIINPFVDIVESAYNTSATISASPKDLNMNLENELKVNSPNDLYSSLEIINNILIKEALYFFENLRTVSDFDKEFNKNDRIKDLYCSEISRRPFVGLSSAVLNKNPESKYWESFYQDKLKNANMHIKNQYEKLVLYLKKNYPDILL